jgi:hypothetical protein
MQHEIEKQIAANSKKSFLPSQEATIPNIRLVESIVNIIEAGSNTHLQIAHECNIR